MIVGMPDLLIALVQSEQRAKGEQHQGNDERVEVTSTSVAERMELVCFLARPLLSEEQ